MTVAGARAVFLDDDEIARVYDEAESKKAGSGWGAVVAVTEERRQQKKTAEAQARTVDLDIDSVYLEAREQNENPVEALVRKIHWVESSKGRSADTAEALLPATRYRADYWVPAVSDDSLDHVAGFLSEQFVAVIVDELRQRHDDNERRESEARYLYNRDRGQACPGRALVEGLLSCVSPSAARLGRAESPRGAPGGGPCGH